MANKKNTPVAAGEAPKPKPPAGRKRGAGKAAVAPAPAEAGAPLSMSAAIEGESPAPALPTRKRGRPAKATQTTPESAAAPVPAAADAVPIDQEVGESVPTVPAEKKLEKDLVKRPAGSLQSSLRVFQIYFENWQRELLDPNFAALDNSKSTSELYEFDVFLRLAQSDYVKGAELWGALSWRFTEKTGMSGQDLVKFIEAHPGHDVYYCNPVPENEALYHNLWLQGETSHPQFLALMQAIFKVTGLPLEELVSIQASDTLSSANYFVATPKFWSAYLPWVQTVLSLANKKLPAQIRDLLHSPQADDRGLHGGATYVPFVIERLFPIFMKTQGKSLKGCKVPLPERERELNVHLKLLCEMKDVAHRTKSAWLAACWVNYRNLYLTQVRGKEWCTKYLRAITPTDIRFG